MTGYNIHGITRVELRDVRNLDDGSPWRQIYVYDRNGNRHDIMLFAAGKDADALRFDIEKEETAE